MTCNKTTAAHFLPRCTVQTWTQSYCGIIYWPALDKYLSPLLPCLTNPVLFVRKGKLGQACSTCDKSMLTVLSPFLLFHMPRNVLWEDCICDFTKSQDEVGWFIDHPCVLFWRCVWLVALLLSLGWVLAWMTPALHAQAALLNSSLALCPCSQPCLLCFYAGVLPSCPFNQVLTEWLVCLHPRVGCSLKVW